MLRIRVIKRRISGQLDIRSDGYSASWISGQLNIRPAGYPASWISGQLNIRPAGYPVLHYFIIITDLCYVEMFQLRFSYVDQLLVAQVEEEVATQVTQGLSYMLYTRKK